MKMPVVVALASVLLFLTVPAKAVTESYPARLALQAVSSTAENSRGPATLFGFELTAYGPRMVSGARQERKRPNVQTVYLPRAVSLFRKTRINSAQESTYQSAMAYCQAVPGSYLFKVSFQ